MVDAACRRGKKRKRAFGGSHFSVSRNRKASADRLDAVINRSILRAAQLRIWFIVFLFAVNGTCVHCQRYIGDAVHIPLVDELVSSGLLVMPTAQWVGNVLTSTLSGTSFSHRVWINRTPKHGFINFYFLKPGFSREANLPPVVRSYRDRLVANCASIGIENTIICDTDFLRAFAYDHELVPKESATSHELGFEAAVNKRLELVQMWIIGHEIGHVLNHDGAAHFDRGDALNGNGQNQGTFEEIRRVRDREYLADRSFARHSTRSSDEPALVSMLIDLVNVEIMTRNGRPDSSGPGFAVDYASTMNNIIYYFDNDSDHPEFMVRAVRLLQQLAGMYHDRALEGLLQGFSYKFKQADAVRPSSK